MYEETNGNNQSGTAANQQSPEPEPVTLLDLADKPIWVAWRSEPPAGGVPHSLPKKRPYQPANGFPASSVNPAHWGTLAAARDRVRRLEIPASFGGVGVVLTEISPDLALFGV